MALRAIRAAAIACAVLAPAQAGEPSGAGADLADLAIPDAWESDEACVSGDAECSLSLRQLRARGASLAAAPLVPETGAAGPAASPTEVPAATGTESLGAEMTADLYGLPGGWGEAASYADQIQNESQQIQSETGNASLSAKTMYLYGSCAQYGCAGHYNRGNGCQCNPTCSYHRNCCGDWYNKCYKPYHQHHHHHASSGGKVMTLFHQTSHEAGQLILKNGFRPGTQGWCGGGIYFATSPQATYTKAIGPDSHKGFMIQATVNVGHVKYMPKECNRQMTGHEVLSEHYDSVSFDPGDGREYIVYSNDRILSTRHINA